MSKAKPPVTINSHLNDAVIAVSEWLIRATDEAAAIQRVKETIDDIHPGCDKVTQLGNDELDELTRTVREFA